MGTHFRWRTSLIRHSLVEGILFHFFILLSNFLPKKSKCVNVFLSTLVKPVSRLVTPAGSCTAWSMASNLMVRCHLTSLSVVVMTRSTPSSPRPDRESMYPVLFSLIWSPRQGRCCQQLCPWTLHHWQGDRRSGAGPRPQAVRPVHRSSRLPHLPLFRRRHRIWFHLSADGTSVGRLWKEI